MNIKKVDIDHAGDIRICIIQSINKFFSSPQIHQEVDKRLIELFTKTIVFLREHPDIIITKADKGNVTVILNKVDYIDKMERMLNDRNTYSIVKKDPTRKMTDDLRSLLSRWRNRNYISSAKSRSLLISDGVFPLAYGLPKIHKVNCPFRVIVSSINRSGRAHV